MAVTLYHKYRVIVNNRVTIKNGTNKDDLKQEPPQEINAKIRSKMYGRRTVNRQN